MTIWIIRICLPYIDISFKITFVEERVVFKLFSVKSRKRKTDTSQRKVFIWLRNKKIVFTLLDIKELEITSPVVTHDATSEWQPGQNWQYPWWLWSHRNSQATAGSGIYHFGKTKARCAPTLWPAVSSLSMQPAETNACVPHKPCVKMAIGFLFIITQNWMQSTCSQW